MKIAANAAALFVLSTQQMEGELAERFFRLQQFFPGLLERFLGLHSLGEVAGHFGEADNAAVAVFGCGDDNIGPKAGAVLAESPAFIFDAAVLDRDGKLALRFAIGRNTRRIGGRGVR